MYNQCPAVYVKQRGKRVTAVFCEKQTGHDGKHKGFRREWSDGEGDQPLVLLNTPRLTITSPGKEETP